MQSTLVTCAICNKQYKYINNTHLKQHGLTIKEYRLKFPESIIWSNDLRKMLNTAHTGKSYEEIMGVNKATQMRELRRKSAIAQMLSADQIAIRKEKCGAAIHYTEQRKHNMSKGITADTISQRRATIEKIYGSYNECMRRAFPGGRTSKSAKSYIEKFLVERNINPERCMYEGGGVTGKEFYQQIMLHGKKKFVMYDLVVFKNLDFHEIDLILEFNGPYHFKLLDVERTPDLKSVYFLDKCETVKYSYEKDIAKLNHALTLTNNVYIYWQKDKQLIKYEGLNY